MRVYKFFGAIIFLSTLSSGLQATVGSVDGSYEKKAAACAHAPENVNKEVSREVNPGNVLANLVPELERSKGQKKPSKGSGGVIQ